jgi:uncharacterized membrane protein
MLGNNSAKALVASAQHYVLAGVLTVIPLWVTWLIFEFLLGLLARVGGPAVTLGSDVLRHYAPGLVAWLMHPWFQSGMAIVLVLAALYAVGWVATHVIGRRLLRTFDQLMDRIPLVKTIYGSMRQLLAVLQQHPDGVQRVVLIEFPSAAMKTIGFVTRTMRDADSGRELVVVYVPTTPNPTSGYLEIVPLDQVTSTDWTIDEAMAFIISGGAAAPATLQYGQSTGTLSEPAH